MLITPTFLLNMKTILLYFAHVPWKYNISKRIFLCKYHNIAKKQRY